MKINDRKISFLIMFSPIIIAIIYPALCFIGEALGFMHNCNEGEMIFIIPLFFITIPLGSIMLFIADSRKNKP